MSNILNKIKKVPNHFWFILFGLISGLAIIYVVVFVFDADVEAWLMPWDDGNKIVDGFNSKLFLVLPWLLLFTVFLMRKKLNGGSDNMKKYTIITLGLFALFWELLHDVSIIHVRRNSPYGVYHEMYNQFILGFSLCRMNVYIIGTFLIFGKTELIKWVAATSLFGAVS